MGQIWVLVKNKLTGEERTMTYHSFKDVSALFELITECTEDGTPIQGSPNLLPRHQGRSLSAAAPVDNAGIPQMTMEEKIAMKERLTAQFSKGISEVPPPPAPTVEVEHKEVVEKKKPGPKPKTAQA